MAQSIIDKIRSFFGQEPELPEDPDPEFVARQLRKPDGVYAPKIAESMNRDNEPLYELTLELMTPSDGESILEIGFGNGLFFEQILSQTEDLKLVGVDYSRDMVDLAEELNEEMVETDRLSLVFGSSDQLRFEDRSFDRILCNNVIYFWEHPANHLSEVHRVLKPGGRFYCGFRTRSSMQQIPAASHGFHLYEPGELEQTLTDNGFEIEQTETRQDPSIEIDDMELQLESVCIVAKRPPDE